jgi:hypothetical protein
VIELEYGITVYPAREGQDRWRAVWHENGKRRQCEAIFEERLAARLEKVTERLAACAGCRISRCSGLDELRVREARAPQLGA